MWQIFKKIPVRKFIRHSMRVFFCNHEKIKENIIMVKIEEGKKTSKELLAIMDRIPQNRTIYVTGGEKQDFFKNNRKVKELKKKTIRYYRKLSQAKGIIELGDNQEDWTKKENQVYVKLENHMSALRYNKQLLKTTEGRWVQMNLFQADYIVCSHEREACLLQDSEILKDFCKAQIFVMETGQVLSFEESDKANVLLYGSALEQNGLTSSLSNMLKKVDLAEKNYWVCAKFSTGVQRAERIQILPENVGVKAMCVSYTLGEFLAEACYYKLNMEWKIFKKKLEKMYLREYRRNFLNMKTDVMIQFTGYEPDIIHLFSKGEGKRIIYVHSDMEREIQIRKAQHRKTLEEMYREYDVVVTINEELMKTTKNIGGEKIYCCTVNNFFDNKSIIEKSKMEVEFSGETISTHTLKEIQDILNGDKKKIITIGRYSKEKGHFMLLEAFAQYHEQHEDTFLFIIGGRGELYEKTIEYAKKLGISKDVVCIKGMNNPMPVLKKCDLFILSSLYEGFGLVVLEAAALGIPVITTDIMGPAKFVREHNGTVVPCTKDGLVKGMELYSKGQILPMDIDFNEYNNECIKQLEMVL